MKQVIAASVIILIAIVVIYTVGSLVVSVAIGDTRDVQFSTDGGAVWQNATIQAVDGTDMQRLRVSALVAAPHDARMLFMGTTRDGLFRGLQGGSVWRQVTEQSGFLSSSTNVTSIAIDRAGRLYVGVEHGNRGSIVRSDDGGTTVREVYTTPEGGVEVTALATDTRDVRTVWTGTSNGLILRSDDFGERWQKIGEFSSGIRDIVLHPAHARTIIVATERRGVFISHNAGADWEDMRSALFEFRGATDVFSVAFDPHRPSVVYMASSFGVLRSNDTGETWEPVRVPIPTTSLPVRDVRVDPDNSDILYVAAGDSLYQSRDRGVSWQVRTLSPDRRVVTHILPLPGTAVVLAGLGR